MKTFVINEFEKLVSEDINDLQAVIHQSIYDRILRPFLQNQDGFLGTSFQPSRTSSTVVTLAAGRGFIYDNTQTGYNPTYTAIDSSASIALTIGSGTWAALPSVNPRIDIIVIKSNTEITDTSSRQIKTAGVGPIQTQVIDKVSAQTYSVLVVEGVEAPSPVVPATPAGYIKIAEVTVAVGSGIVSASDVVDVRTILLPAVQVLNSEDRYVAPSGNGTDLTLQSAVANLPVGGGSILILEDIDMSSTIVIPANTTVRGKSRGTTITMLAGAKLELEENCDISSLTFASVETALTFVEITENFCNIQKCYFAGPSGGSNTYVKVSSDGNNVELCKFDYTILPETNTGIEFGSGTSSNSEEKNIYTN